MANDNAQSPAKKPRAVPEGFIPINQRPPEEQFAMRSKGGKKTAENRRKKRETAELIGMIMDAVREENPQSRALMNQVGLDPDEPVTMRLMAILRAAMKASQGDVKTLQVLYDIEDRSRRNDREDRRLDQQLELDRKRFDLEYEKFHRNDVENNLDAIQNQLTSIADMMRNPVRDRTIDDIENATEEEMAREDAIKKAREQEQEKAKEEKPTPKPKEKKQEGPKLKKDGTPRKKPGVKPGTKKGKYKKTRIKEDTEAALDLLHNVIENNLSDKKGPEKKEPEKKTSEKPTPAPVKRTRKKDSE